MPVIRTCRTCGRRNRVPAGHLSDTGRCGVCTASLPPLNEPLEVDPELFTEIVQNARVPVLVDFWAAWCGPAVWPRLRLHAQLRTWPARQLS
jgi:thioredoxin 2